MTRKITVAVSLSLLAGAAALGGGCSSGGSPGSGAAGSPAVAGGGTAGSNAPSAGAPAVAGASTAGSVGVSGAPSTAGAGACDSAPNLVWKTANKTNYESYPAPGSQECIEFNGCAYEGQFAACDKTETLDWVKTHNIVAAFPDLKTLQLHDLCLKKGDKTIVVTVYDTCGDADCDGCCTENKGNKDELIDVEKYTDQRWGVDDGAIQWADLGPTKGMGCN